MRDLPNHVIGHWLEICLALWITVVFAERLVVNLATHKYSSHDRMRKALHDPAVHFYVPLGFVLLLMSLLVRKSTLDYFAEWIGRWLYALLGELYDPSTYVTAGVVLAVVWFYLLFKSMSKRISVSELLQDWFHEFNEVCRENLALFLLVLAIFSLYASLTMLASQFPLDPEIKDIVNSWASSNIFVVLNTVLYVSVYWRVFRPHVDAPSMKILFWSGYLKDTTIYTVAALYLGNGLYRFLATLPHLSPAHIWQTFAIFAGATVLVGTFGIAMDLLYAAKIDVPGSRFWKECPQREQRRIAYAHTYFRAFVVFVLPLFLWYGYVLVKCAKAATR